MKTSLILFITFLTISLNAQDNFVPQSIMFEKNYKVEQNSLNIEETLKEIRRGGAHIQSGAGLMTLGFLITAGGAIVALNTDNFGVENKDNFRTAILGISTSLGVMANIFGVTRIAKGGKIIARSKIE